MRTTLIAAGMAVLMTASLGATQADAANARSPYANIDRRKDAGNDTGNAQVDRLNESQLDRNYQGPTYPMQPRTGPSAYPPAAVGQAPGYAPMPAAPQRY